MEMLGSHQRTEVRGNKDCNGLTMVACLDCRTCAHAVDEATAKADLARTACVPDCENCNNLRVSYDGKPAVPLGGSCNNLTHICPIDGNRWWQSNDHFHLWQQVTSDEEWKIVQSWRSRPPDDFD